MSSSPIQIPWISRRPLLQRSHQIAAVLVKHGLGWLLTRVPASAAGGTQAIQKMLMRNGHSGAEELVSALVELGPTFIKFGQALSSRTDLLPADYTDELSKLQDLVPPVPFEMMQSVLIQELGREPKEVFSELNPIPIASASIGQVYAGRLWGGDEVVVKIVRPHAEKTFEQDLEILNDIADWVTQHTALGELYDLRTLIEEFAYTVRAEFDYLREGRNADLFRKNFADDPAIYVPVVYWDFTTRNVIVMERVNGLKFNDLAALDAAGIDRRIVAENLMHFALRQIFDFRFYHADPHPGNFFVQPDGSLAVVDFGMVGRLNQHTKRTLLGIAQAVERNDAHMLVDEFLEAGIYTRAVDRIKFTRDLQRMLDRFNGASIKELSATTVLSAVMDVILRNGLQLPGELVAMTRAITISEGTGTLLYPEFNLFDFAAPYLRNFGKEETSPANMLPRITAAAVDSMELGLGLPRRMQRILMQLEQGKFEVSINKRELDDTISKLQKMTNRLTLGMILAAVIIALALVLVIYQSETWEIIGSYVFGFALISSILFGIWLLWSIIRSGRT